MIKYFAVENFKSIKNEAILEFDQHLGKDYPYPSSSIIGVAGANASGKTCFLQALTFVLWFMQHSFLELPEDGDIPYTSFIGHGDSPTNFCLIFSIKQLIDQKQKWIDYEYNLTLLSNAVVKEELYSYPYKRKRKVYSRNKRKVSYGTREDIKPLDQEILDNLRDNCSLISFTAQYATQKIAKKIQKQLIKSNLDHKPISENEFQFAPSMMQSFLTNEALKYKIKTLLKIADIGIEDFSFQPEMLDPLWQELYNDIDRMKTEHNQNQRVLTQLYNLINELAPQVSEIDQISELNNARDVMDKISNHTPNAINELEKSIHNVELYNKDEIKNALLFHHTIDNKLQSFVYTLESSGTLQFLALVSNILEILEKGGILIIDEIELKLHQNLVAYLIGLFQNREENPHGAQLIFSFHNTSLMEILEPHQLYFTEKNDQGQTEIFSAADFTDIKDLYKRNLEELYRIGRFGAKPRGI